MPSNKPEPEYEGKPLSRWVADTKDKDSMVRIAAALALGRSVPRRRQPSRPSRKCSGTKMSKFGWPLLRRWGRSGPEAGRALPALANLFKDKNPQVRYNAVWASKTIGRLSIPTLTEFLNDEDCQIRLATTLVLGKIGSRGEGSYSCPHGITQGQG